MAHETSELEGGTFTYFLPEGLKRACNVDRDNLIAVQEICYYVRDRVNAESTRRSSVAQLP